jgi:hypothetical protein
LAKEAGLKTVAKVQLNTSWELSSLPYLPVLDLVAQHCRNLARAGVDGMMLSWSLGGYPSPNLKVAHHFGRDPTLTVDEALDRVARDCFGPEGAPHARKAWTAFSKAFAEYPYHIGVLYKAPVQLGPANLFYPSKTGWQATMVGFPYDDLTSWRGPYPPEIFAAQFEKMAVGWQKGLAELELAVENSPPEKRGEAEFEFVVLPIILAVSGAETCGVIASSKTAARPPRRFLCFCDCFAMRYRNGKRGWRIVGRRCLKDRKKFRWTARPTLAMTAAA